MTRIVWCGIFCWLTISARADEQPRDASERPPNVIVILCDNLGYGDIEPFGSTEHQTPSLNRMAAEGRKFTHFCVTAGVCTPSRASLMTGCYAQRVGMHDNPRDGQVLRPVSPYGLNPAEITIAEVCKRQGYRTALIGKWHLGDQLEFLPTRQGFDEFLGIPYSDDMTQDVGQRLGERLDGLKWPPLPLMRDARVVDAPVDRNTLTQRYTEAALQFIDKADDRPFFLLLSHAMPGSTSRPFVSDAFRGKSKSGPWGDSVQELDWSTGQILDKLQEKGLATNTWVVWTSDNGAPMARNASQPFRGTNAPLRGRGYTTAEGAFRVPTIMWWPGRIPANTQCDELCTTLDLLPTVAALCGDSQAPGVDGFDIRNLLFESSPESSASPYQAFYYYERDQLQAVRSGPWKLFVAVKEFTNHPHFKAGKPNSAMLFNVVEDIACEHDVAGQHPEVVQRLEALAEKARQDLGDRGVTGRGVRQPGHIDQPTPRLLFSQ